MREEEADVVGLVADAETWTDLRLSFFELECLAINFLFVLVVMVEDAVSSSSLTTVAVVGLFGAYSGDDLETSLLRSFS